MPGESALAIVGVIARPHGVRGELRVHLYNKGSEALVGRQSVVLCESDGSTRVAKVRRGRKGPGTFLLELEGCASREDAEKLRGIEVAVPRSELPPPDEGEFYFMDLIGLPARLEDGTPVGEVVRVIEYPSVECLLVRSEEGDREVPLVDPWVRAVDLEAGEVVVSQLEDIPIQRPRVPRER